jgi:hypothetical protein
MAQHARDVLRANPSRASLPEGRHTVIIVILPLQETDPKSA